MKFLNAFWRKRADKTPPRRQPTPMDVRQLSRLDRLAGAGAVRVTFTAYDDGRNTPLERSLDNEEMTIAQARDLVIDHGHEIPCAVFRPIERYLNSDA